MTKEYHTNVEKITALDNLEIRIQDGEAIAIIGPSGSGKTTLLNLIACIDKPTNGEIIVDGISLGHLDDQQASHYRRKSIGYIFQLHNLLPYLTAIENIELPMMANRMPKSERYQRAQILLESVGLDNRTNQYPSQLSGGERQRVAIARALANYPKIILADEPTGHLDWSIGRKIMDIMITLTRQFNGILLMATHDPRAEEIMDRSIKLIDGEIDCS